MKLSSLSLATLTAFALAATPGGLARDPAGKASVRPSTKDTSKAPIPLGFALIPAGEFMMGDPRDWEINTSPHKVNVSALFMQKKEVTRAQWIEVREWGLKHGYTDLPEGKGKADDHPEYSVSWYSVVKWCNARSEKEGIVPCYYTDTTQMALYRRGDMDISNAMVKWNATGYRLPTEAEWEKAARGGLIGKRFPLGDTISHNQANFDNSDGETFQTGSTSFNPAYATGGFPYTSPVGSFAPNGYGLYDMAGNAWEWCWDWYRDYPVALETDPRGPLFGSERLVRGGSWRLTAAYCCVELRCSRPPRVDDDAFGLRVVRSCARPD